MRFFTKHHAAALACVALGAAGGARADELADAFKAGKPYIDARYRYEFVDQDGLPKNARASTLRTRLGYASGELYGLSGVLEFENIAVIGSDDYNDTINGNVTRPVVADPEGTEVNQAYIQYKGVPDTAIKVGRQAITVGNERFVGPVGWRQNNQTFDAASIANASLPDTSLTYAYIENVNRIFGDDSPAGDWESDSHIAYASNGSTPLGTLFGYGYFLDFGADAPAMSSATYGVGAEGNFPLQHGFSLGYRIEFARQSDYADNPANYDADYFHIAPSIGYRGATLTVAMESLGSDNGAAAFQTPLGTLHKFNGWADKFLVTPIQGLEDVYVDLAYDFSGLADKAPVFKGMKAKAQYHEFGAENTNADYGKEFDAFLKKSFGPHYYVEGKYADFRSDGFATDTQKFIIDLGLVY